MKKIIYIPILLLLIGSLLGLTASAKEAQYRLTGRTCETDGKAIEYATVLLIPSADTTDVRGMSSEQDGRFSLQAPAGQYTLRTAFIGYETVEKPVALDSNTDLGNIIMPTSTIEVDAVVVIADVIRREADRFVVDIENSPSAIGQSASEVLAQSPGVWVDERSGISINGRSGTKVYINEREIRETGEDLVNYLKTIKAEDIKRIDIIPIGGVEYDADAQGGIIKITLKQQRENGLEGSVSMNYRTSLYKDQYAHQMNPSFNINYMVNKLRIYASGSEWFNKNRSVNTFYTKDKNGNIQDEVLNMDNVNNWPNIRLGGLYDINDKHTVGLEVNYRGFLKGHQDIYSEGEYLQNGLSSEVNGHSFLKWHFPSLNVSGNYIMKLDTVGSTFKLILDYYYRENKDWGDYNQSSSGAVLYDSLYASRQNGISDWYIGTLDFDLKAGPKSSFKTGVKHSHRNVESWQRYTYDQNGTTYPIVPMNFNIGFTEDITALYGNFSTRFDNNISLSVGLRGEYTYSRPESEGVNSIKKQNYLSLFPAGNLSIPLHKEGKHSMILAYSRKINRPWYYNLIPNRFQVSDGKYSIGNPDLKPAFANDYSLSFVFNQKYNVTLMIQHVKDEMNQQAFIDPNDPSMIGVMQVNMKKTLYGVNVNLPAQVRPWWKLTANLMGSYVNSGEKGNMNELFSFRGNLGNTFTVAEKVHITLDGFYMAPMLQGTVKSLSYYVVNTGIRYSFAKDKITAGITLHDVFNTGKYRFEFKTPEFEKTRMTNRWNPRMIGFSIRYNFKKGKDFKIRNVESGGGGQENEGGK